MSLTLHSLSTKPGSTKSVRRVGRGHGSGRGKTSGRGTKGQKSRTGGSKGLKRMGVRRMLLSIPKLRGFKRESLPIREITLSELSTLFTDGTTVTIDSLRSRHVLKSGWRCKILQSGELTRRGLVIEGIPCSAGARSAIEGMGGSVKAIAKKKKRA